MLGSLLLLLSPLAEALPFVTTWNISEAFTVINVPKIYAQSSVTVNWGDFSGFDSANAGTLVGFNHTYNAPGLYNVSIEGQIFWSQDKYNIRELVDIVSWGDGFLVNESSGSLFAAKVNLRVSAPASTQPVFLPGANLQGMFAITLFNSPLDWDLANVTDISWMFDGTPLNKPITFRNTKGVTSIRSLFSGTNFNQPFHFDASNVLDASYMFLGCSAFNQVVELTNSAKLNDTDGMFFNARSFNQPLAMDTSSVTSMSGMFSGATSFASTVSFTSTAQVTDMTSMFFGANWFSQDLSSWDTSNVALCAYFCPWCGLPVFPQCVPCSPRYNDSQNPTMSVCTSGIRTPTTASTSAPSTASTSAPSPASTHAPTPPTDSSSVSAAPSSVPRGLVVALLGAMLTMAHGAQ